MRFDPGEPDGVWGAKTQNAAEVFLRLRGAERPAQALLQWSEEFDDLLDTARRDEFLNGGCMTVVKKIPAIVDTTPTFDYLEQGDVLTEVRSCSPSSCRSGQECRYSYSRDGHSQCEDDFPVQSVLSKLAKECSSWGGALEPEDAGVDCECPIDGSCTCELEVFCSIIVEVSGTPSTNIVREEQTVEVEECYCADDSSCLDG